VFLLIALFHIGLSRVSAQDNVKDLKLNDAIKAALNNIKTIQLAKLDESIAVKDTVAADKVKAIGNSVMLPVSSIDHKD
jgi:hypothetical protein